MTLVKNLQVGGLARYLRVVQETSHVSQDLESKGSALVTFWHDGILPLLAATVGAKNVAIYVRAQPFLDDTLDLLKYLGVPAFVSDHRGTAGIKAARRWLSEPGRLLAVSADAAEPRVAQPGVARLARVLGVPLRPLAVTASRGYRMSRWNPCIVPHLAGELTVRALAPVSEGSLEATASAVQSALSAVTLAEPIAGELVPWRRAFDIWPRLCLLPRTRGKLSVWPAKEAVTVSF